MSDHRISNHPGIELPLPPESGHRLDMDIYARFMRHLRHVACSRPEIKILRSIQFVADMTGNHDALIAKTLVDCGLKAPRDAFPESFLAHVDQSMAGHNSILQAGSSRYLKLAEHWMDHGEDRFTPARASFDIPNIYSFKARQEELA